MVSGLRAALERASGVVQAVELTADANNHFFDDPTLIGLRRWERGDQVSQLRVELSLQRAKGAQIGRAVSDPALAGLARDHSHVRRGAIAHGPADLRCVTPRFTGDGDHGFGRIGHLKSARIGPDHGVKVWVSAIAGPNRHRINGVKAPLFDRDSGLNRVRGKSLGRCQRFGANGPRLIKEIRRDGRPITLIQVAETAETKADGHRCSRADEHDGHFIAGITRDDDRPHHHEVVDGSPIDGEQPIARPQHFGGGKARDERLKEDASLAAELVSHDAHAGSGLGAEAAVRGLKEPAALFGGEVETSGGGFDVLEPNGPSFDQPTLGIHPESDIIGIEIRNDSLEKDGAFDWGFGLRTR